MVTLPQSETERIKKQLSRKSIKIISTIQLISAFVAVITEIVIISNGNRGWGYFPILGTGIWTGIFFAISGCIGLLTAQKPSKCKYVSGPYEQP